MTLPTGVHRSRRPPVVKRLALGVLFAASLFYLLAPPAWMVISSLSPDRELLARPPHWIPSEITAVHYRTLFQLRGADAREAEQNPQIRAFTRSFLNSLTLASVTVVICLVCGSVSAYSLTRFVRPGRRNVILFCLLGTRMLPVIAVLIPIYMGLQRVGLLDTLSGLILADAGLLLPFVIWILEGFYRTFPVELEEAAAIDGCSPTHIFTRIVLPLSSNSLFAAGAFVFIAAWSDFIVALVLTATERAWPLSVVLAQSLNAITNPSWGLMNSAGLMTAVVPALLAVIFRGAVMRGLLGGAVKG
ncbi:MAG TPA: carbohydrate ABC transporter permease [bacterium]|nr:carbohydrate ABC transporter permease [bacterium]